MHSLIISQLYQRRQPRFQLVQSSARRLTAKRGDLSKDGGQTVPVVDDIDMVVKKTTLFSLLWKLDSSCKDPKEATDSLGSPPGFQHVSNQGGVGDKKALFGHFEH